LLSFHVQAHVMCLAVDLIRESRDFLSAWACLPFERHLAFCYPDVTTDLILQ
jgi:hypothetical protein